MESLSDNGLLPLGGNSVTERVHIRQRYRQEFEQLGEIDLRKSLRLVQLDEDKRKAGWAWLDEKAQGASLQGQTTCLARAGRSKNQHLAGLRACCPDHLRCRTAPQLALKHLDATGHRTEAVIATASSDAGGL